MKFKTKVTAEWLKGGTIKITNDIGNYWLFHVGFGKEMSSTPYTAISQCISMMLTATINNTLRRAIENDREKIEITLSSSE